MKEVKKFENHSLRVVINISFFGARIITWPHRTWNHQSFIIFWNILHGNINGHVFTIFRVWYSGGRFDLELIFFDFEEFFEIIRSGTISISIFPGLPFFRGIFWILIIIRKNLSLTWSDRFCWNVESYRSFIS